jgi:dienelactone hydrolase
MTKPPETHIEPAVAAAPRGDRLLPPARYRHPGDVTRLIVAGFVLTGTLAVTIAAHATYAGASAAAVSAAAPSTLAGRVGRPGADAVRGGRRRGRGCHVALPPVPLLLGLAGSAVLASAVVPSTRRFNWPGMNLAWPPPAGSAPMG